MPASFKARRGTKPALTALRAVRIVQANEKRMKYKKGGRIMNMNDVILGRAERLPVTGLHRRIMVILGFGTFFDAYDTLAIASALTVIFSSLHIDFVATGMLIGAGYVGQLIGAVLFGVLSEVWGRKKSFIWPYRSWGCFRSPPRCRGISKALRCRGRCSASAWAERRRSPAR